MEVLRTKSIEQSLGDSEEPGRQLRKSLGPIQLTVIGIGVIIGTGIFVLTGEAAGTIAGPAITFSFIAAAIGVIFLRRLRPDLKRPFRTPLAPWLPILSVLASLWLMLNLQSATWVRFGFGCWSA
jgi:amino acid transporter